MQVKNIRDVPVSTFIAVGIITVFALYTTTALKTIPCGKDVMSVFISNFIHVEPAHLIANLYALYALSRVEEALGIKRFLTLVIFLLIINTIIESVFHRVCPQISCGIGFSGVLYGMVTWEFVTQKKLDMYLITSIIAMVAVPSLGNTNVSLLGHGVGAISGIIGGLLWNKLVK
jgi:membrane associated rhomboid family serine protease